MVHGDDTGLVLPPMVAGIQVIIIPVAITKKTSQETKDQMTKLIFEYEAQLKSAGIRAKVDDGDNYNSGWKFNYYERKGVPLRMELGPKDVEKGCVCLSRRDKPEKSDKIFLQDSELVTGVRKVLDDIQESLYAKALADRDAHLAVIDEWSDFSPNLNAKKLLLVPFCGDKECEEAIKEKSKAEAAEMEVEGGLKMGAKSLCIPAEEKYQAAFPSQCILPGCKIPSQFRTMFGRSY